MKRLCAFLLLLTAVLQLSAQTNAKKIHYTGKTLSNPNRHDGGLSPVVGVHNIQILRANRPLPLRPEG